MCESLDRLGGHIQIVFLIAYTPDLILVEYLWARPTRRALAKYCPRNLRELRLSVRDKLKSAQKRPSIVAACRMQTTLW